MTDAEEVSGKLDVIIRLLAAQLTAGKKQKDQIAALTSVGLSSTQIAEIIGAKANVVRAVQSRQRGA